jgi:hypothetical protein
MKSFLAGLGVLLLIAFSVAQLAAGFAGIQHGLGVGWAWAAIVVAFAFRFTLPITIGAFFGAMNVWGWHWAFAALFAMPGLIFIVPSMFASAFSMLRR